MLDANDSRLDLPHHGHWRGVWSLRPQDSPQIHQWTSISKVYIFSRYDQCSSPDLLSSCGLRLKRKVSKMPDVLIENAATQVLPHKKQLPSSIPNIDSLEGLGTDGGDEYSTLKKLQRHLECVQSRKLLDAIFKLLNEIQIHQLTRRIHQG